MNNAPGVLDKQILATSAVRTAIKITADASGGLPQKVMLIPAGQWTGSVKGDIEITEQDLQEFKANFYAGKGLPAQGSEGAPVDYMHEDWAKAAAWILDVDVMQGALWATRIAYTPAGAQAIKDGEFKFISPSFFPACRGMWVDHQDPTNTARNVFVGAGLTNIPFFADMAGLKASKSGGDSSRPENMIYINADSKGETMDLEQVRKMNKDDLSQEQREFLLTNKESLSADEIIALGLEEKPADQPAADPQPSPAPTGDTPTGDQPNPTQDEETKKAAELQASIKAGTHMVVPTAEYKGLQASVKALEKVAEDTRKEKVIASVNQHISRGAIKADQRDKWVDRIMADATMEEDLAALPDNKLMATELGAEGSEVSVNDQIQQKIKAAMEADSKLTLSQATIKVAKENPDLVNQRQTVTK